MGGAKKSFGAEQLSADLDGVKIRELLDYLLSIKPKDTTNLDTQNTLIAVNGVDSSALDGLDTVIKSGDSVSIIPVIHGGQKRAQIKAGGSRAEIFNVSCKKGKNYDYLELARRKFPRLVIVGVDSRCLLGPTHAEKILGVSLFAQRKSLLLSKKLETDILLRFAGTNQISNAIRLVGIESSDEFAVIALGSKGDLERLRKFLGPNLVPFNYKKNPKFLQKLFKVSKRNIDAVFSKTPLEDLLVERAAVLFR